MYNVSSGVNVFLCTFDLMLRNEFSLLMTHMLLSVGACVCLCAVCVYDSVALCDVDGGVKCVVV
jgi:hypothetical protein